MTDEQKAARTILKENKDIRIGNRVISMPPITPSTWIAVSAIVSALPISDDTREKIPYGEMLAGVLLEAKEYGAIGEIIASLAIGRRKKESWWRKRKLRKLADYIMDEIPGSELNGIIQNLLDELAVQHFFQFTASLSELNILRGKRKAVQSGG